MAEAPPVNRYSEPGLYPWGRIVLFIFSMIIIQAVVRGLEYSFSITATEEDVLIAVLLSAYLIWLANSLNLKFSHAILLIGIEILVIMFLNNLIEGYFFTDVVSTASEMAISIAYALAFSILTALATAIVYFQPHPSFDLWENLKARLSMGSKAGWVLRLLLTGPIFLAVYFLFGMLVSPFVTPFYNDPSLGLKIPSISVIIPVEIARGMIYGIVLLPLMASFRYEKLYSYITVSMMLFVVGALVPLIGAPLPAPIIPYHIVEILGDSLVFGYILMWLYRQN